MLEKRFARLGKFFLSWNREYTSIRLLCVHRNLRYNLFGVFPWMRLSYIFTLRNCHRKLQHKSGNRFLFFLSYGICNKPQIYIRSKRYRLRTTKFSRPSFHVEQIDYASSSSDFPSASSSLQLGRYQALEPPRFRFDRIRDQRTYICDTPQLGQVERDSNLEKRFK